MHENRLRLRSRLSMIGLSRRARLSALAGATTLFVLAGATASWALWTASASFSSTASGATVAVTHALSGSTLGVTYDLATTAAVDTVRVTNTSTRSGTYSLALSATSASATLRSAVTVEVGTAASCTTTATLTAPVSGTFAATVTKTGTLAAGAFVDLCVRTSMTSTAIAANTSTSLAATIATSVAVGTWSATAAPAITFTQAVGAGTVNSSAWYWLSSVLNPALCLEGLNSGTANGTALVQGTCTAPSGTAANELFRFTPTTGGYFRIVYKQAPTLAIGRTAGGNNNPEGLYTNTGTRLEWRVIVNSDSTITLQSRNNTGRCLTIPGGSTTAGTVIQIQSCVTGSNSQRFRLTMFGNATPAPIALTCSADGYNAYYSWPQLTGYETEVVYRVYIGGILVTPHTRGTGWDPTVQFSSGSITVGTYGAGSKAVLVQQNVANAGWTTTGTGTLVIAGAAPFLQCG